MILVRRRETGRLDDHGEGRSQTTYDQEVAGRFARR